MTEYWKSLEKKFCDTCKCWLSDNRASIEFHENGKRHKENIQRRLAEIQKSTRKQEKSDKKVNKDLKRIEEAAAAAVLKDSLENPDISLQIATALSEREDARRRESGLAPETPEEREAREGRGKVKKEVLPQPKILHREEKPNSNKTKPIGTPAYTSKGGWTTMGQTSSGLDLELPPKNVPFHPIYHRHAQGKRTKPTNSFEQDSLVSKDEHKLPSFSLSSSSTSTSTAGSSEEVVFKKRKFARSNMRQRDEEL